MKDRIKAIMSSVGLSQARFAEVVQLNPSTLSHALSGRNEVSKDIILKIHQAYPHISINWLMFGEGSMREAKTASIYPQTQSSSSIFPPNYDSESELSAPVSEVVAAQATENASQQPLPLLAPAQPAKQVTKIMVFYSDNTFDTFSPDNF